jgi:hypothetical protein
MRARSWDPLGPVLAIVAGVVYAVGGWNGVLNRDLGLFVYGGQRFLDGEPPYTGVFNRVGPLADMLPGVGIALGRAVGLADVHGARAFYLVLSAVCVGLLYVVARDVLGSRTAAVVACAAFLCFETFTELAGSGPRDKTAMLVFLLAALVAARARRWWAFGGLTALATLTWQPAFVPLLVAGVVGIVSGREATRPLVAALRVCVAGLVTTLVFAAYFWSEGGLSRAIDGFLLVNLTDTSQPSPLKNPPYVWQFLTNGYGWSLYLVLVGLAVALLALVPQVARIAGLDRDYLVVGLAGATAAAWSTYALNGPPDMFVVLPFAAIGIGIVGLLLERRTSPAPAVALACVLTVAAGAQAVSLRDDTLVAQQASVDAMLRTTPDASMLSVAAPEALALAGRRNPTPYQLFALGFDQYVEDEWPGGLEGYAEYVRTERPELIVISTGSTPDWLVPVLADDYRRVGSAPKWFWYASTALPAEQLDELHSALKAAKP